MRILSLLIFCSLIAFIFNQLGGICDPAYKNGVDRLKDCSSVDKASNYNECCMIAYTDYDGESFKVCYEMDARTIIHYEQNKQKIKDYISKTYSNNAEVKDLDYYECSSKYLKMSLLALALILF